MILGPPTCVPLEKLPISISPENSNLQQVAYRNNGSVLPERYHRLGRRPRIQGEAVKPSGKYECLNDSHQKGTLNVLYGVL